jgi:hypothetical protein
MQSDKVDNLLWQRNPNNKEVRESEIPHDGKSRTTGNIFVSG